MFDTMTMTKIAAGLCSTFLVFLLGGWAAESIYHVGGSGHGDHEQAYSIPVAGGNEEPEEEEIIDYAALMAAADLASGEQIFTRKCSACHKVNDGENSTGPHLFGIVDRAVGGVADFGYSGSLVAVADVWDVEHLFGFIGNPRSYAPGTAMGFAGLNKPDERADVIAYLQSIGN